MAIKFKVVKAKHQCATPIEALQLAEDIERLTLILVLIGRLSPESISADRSAGDDELWRVSAIFRAWKRVAEQQLRRDYLAVESEVRPRRR